MSVLSRRTGVVLVATALVASGVLTAAPSSAAPKDRIVRTAYDVPGSCSQAGGFRTGMPTTLSSLRLVVRPSSPAPGERVLVKVRVQHDLSTPVGAYYPAGILRGQVVVRIGAGRTILRGPTNTESFTGAIFPDGWVAKKRVRIPEAGRYRVSVARIAYNVRGGGSGSWKRPFTGFDLVCSGGTDPDSPRPFSAPRARLDVAAPF